MRASRRAVSLAASFAGALLLLELGASFTTTNRLWGLDALSVFGLVTRTAWAAATAVFFAAAWRRGFPEAHLDGRALIASAAGVTVAFVALSYGLREAVPLWGDGYLRLERLTEGKLANTFAGRSELDSFLQLAAFRAIGPWFGGRAAPVAALWSVAMGALFVPLAFAAARRAVAPERVPAAVALLLSGGAAALFFGHIESYATFATALLGALVLGAMALGGSLPRIVAVLALAPLALVHPEALALLPATALLAWAPAPKGRARALEALAATALAAFLAIQLARGLRDLGAQAGRGALLDLPARLAGALNEWALVHPAALLLAAAVLLACGARHTLLDRRTAYFGLAAAGFFILPLVVTPELGPMRDWDLFAPLAVPLALFAARIVEAAPFGLPAKRRLYGIAVVAAVAHAAPWIAMNASEPHLVERYRRLLDARPVLPPSSEGLARGAFGDYLVSKGRGEEAIASYTQAWDLSRRATYLERLADLYRARGDTTRADSLSRALVERAGARSESHMDRGMFLVGRKRYEEAAGEFEKALAIDPGSAAAKVNLGGALANAGRVEQGRALIEEATREHPRFVPAELALGYLDLHDRRFDESRAHFARALEIDPHNEAAQAGLRALKNAEPSP